LRLAALRIVAIAGYDSSSRLASHNIQHTLQTIQLRNLICIDLSTIGITVFNISYLVYLIGHNRPIAELLAPRAKPLADVYESEFKGMTFNDVGVAVLEVTLSRLVESLHARLTDTDRAFLLSFKEGVPTWKHLGIPHIEQLPSVRWKLLNLDKMNKKKRVEAIGNLEVVLGGRQHV